MGGVGDVPDTGIRLPAVEGLSDMFGDDGVSETGHGVGPRAGGRVVGAESRWDFGECKGWRLVVDTGIFAAELRSRSPPLAQRYAPLLVSRQPVTAGQTIREVYSGAWKVDWGETRLRHLVQCGTNGP